LNGPIQKCKDITDERDALLLEAEIITAGGDTLNRDRDFLKLETHNLRAQHRAVALLKEQLNIIRVPCEEIAKARHSFKLRSRRSEANRNALSKIIEALKVETEELLAQYNDYSLVAKQLNIVRQQCKNVKKERNAFILRAQLIADSREIVKVERDALKLEIENLRPKIKDTDLLETQLNVVREDCENMAEERDSLIFEAQYMGRDREATKGGQADDALLEGQFKIVREDCENIGKELDFLILESKHIETDRKARERDLDDGAQLEEEFDVVKECDNINKQIDSVILEVQHMGTDREAIKGELEDAELLEEQLNVVRKDCDNIAKELDSLIFEVQHMGTDRKVTEEDRNDDALLGKQLNVVRMKCDNIAKERHSFKLRMRRAEANRKAISKVTEALKFGTEEIRAQFNDYTLLKKQLNTIGQQCEKVRKERNAFVLRVQHIAESREAMKFERDALKLEKENLRAKIKGADMLEKELNAANYMTST
jgi:hypothetical protein